MSMAPTVSVDFKHRCAVLDTSAWNIVEDLPTPFTQCTITSSLHVNVDICIPSMFRPGCRMRQLAYPAICHAKHSTACYKALKCSILDEKPQFNGTTIEKYSGSNVT